MIKRITIALLLMASTCYAEPESMIQISDETKIELFKKLFEEKGIPYKLQNGNQFFYPISYGEKVKQVREDVWGPIDNSRKGVTLNIKVAPILASELVKNGVAFMVIPSEEEAVFTWEVYYHKTAMEVAYEVVP